MKFLVSECRKEMSIHQGGGASIFLSHSEGRSNEDHAIATHKQHRNVPFCGLRGKKQVFFNNLSDKCSTDELFLSREIVSN